MVKASFATACIKYFGRFPGQTITQFQEELKKLTEKDRKDLKAMFATVGYEIVDNP